MAQDTPARRELERILDEFAAGRLPSIGFMGKVKKLRDENPGLISADPALGVAVVAGFAHHTAGRDLMSLLLEIEGFEVRNAQIGYRDSDVVSMCSDPDVSVLCLSAQSTEGANGVMDIIREIDADTRRRIVFNAGGSPVSETYAKSLGCDVFSQSAVESARLIRAEVCSRRGLSPNA